MPLYNVTVTIETTMVVLADDAAHAHAFACMNARKGIDDGDEQPNAHVTGEVRSARDLKDGWDVDCSPYGDESNRKISDHLEVKS